MKVHYFQNCHGFRVGKVFLTAYYIEASFDDLIPVSVDAIRAERVTSRVHFLPAEAARITEAGTAIWQAREPSQ